MKILHINCNYIGTTLHQLMVEKLDKMGLDNSVFVPTYDKNVAVIKPNSNVCVSECFKKWDRLIFDYKQRKIQKSIESHYDIGLFECIHAYTLFTDGNCARNLSKKYNIPYVVAVRNTDVNDFFRLMPHLRRRGVKIMRDASAVFFLSDAYRRQVFDRYIPKKYHDEILKKTQIIPNGIDDFWLSNKPCEKEIPGKDIKLIYAGRIDKNKNIPTTQKAVDLLCQKGYNATLTVVGKVIDEGEFSRIKEHNNTNYINAMPKEKLIEQYRCHDIFVMPSFTESFGLVYAEAMSQGLPVIYSENQGFDRQFPEGEVGYRVISSSPDDIVSSVKKILSDYENISKNCVVNAGRFKWDTIAERYADIYKNILE